MGSRSKRVVPAPIPTYLRVYEGKRVLSDSKGTYFYIYIYMYNIRIVDCWVWLDSSWKLRLNSWLLSGRCWLGVRQQRRSAVLDTRPFLVCMMDSPECHCFKDPGWANTGGIPLSKPVEHPSCIFCPTTATKSDWSPVWTALLGGLWSWAGHIWCFQGLLQLSPSSPTG